MKHKRKWLAAAIAGSLGGMQTAPATTITVNSSSDAFVIGGSTACTLRGAVAAANTNTQQIGCSAGSAVDVDVIEFGPGIQGSTISLQQGEIDITSSLTIEADLSFRSGVTINAGQSSRIFQIDDGNAGAVQQVTLRGLTLINGSVTNSDGGAIVNRQEEVLLEACTLSNNTAIFGLAAAGGRGGAIHNFRGQITLNDSVVSGNTADLGGGGLFSREFSTLVLNNSQVTDNRASYGAGITSAVAVVGQSPSSLTINGGSVSGNSALTSSGGGVFLRGIANLTGVEMRNNVAQSAGGALSVSNEGTQAQLTDVVLSNNSAGSEGGAVRGNSDTDVSLLRAEVVNNYAEDSGGGITSTGMLTITDSTISGNTAGDGSSLNQIGGGIETLSSGTLTMSGSRLDSNTASRGGGLYAGGASTLIETSVTANSASTAGGGLYVRNAMTVLGSTISGNTAGNGAAIMSLATPTTVLTNTTISNNTAVGGVGASYTSAVYSFSALVISNSTLVANAPNTLTKASGTNYWAMTNTVIVDSVLADCVDSVIPLDVNLNNLVGDGTCAGGAVEFLMGDPMLGPLADNGGATATHLPLTGSPLVDAGSNSNCPGPDQAGMPRPIDGNADGDIECDIGSIEFVDLFPPLSTITSAPDVTVAGASSYALEVTYTDIDGQVDFATVGAGDLNVSPNSLVVDSVALAGTPSQLVVTYTLLPPGGQWEAEDSGEYSVSINADEVLDTATTGANAVPAGLLGSFSVAITDIEVRGDGLEIADGDATPQAGDNTAFGDVAVGNALTRSFTVLNAGGGTLTLTAPIEIFGAGFSITQPAQTILGPGEASEFSVTFEPLGVGSLTGQVTLLNDDADENPYTFAVSGSGQPLTELIFENGFE